MKSSFNRDHNNYCASLRHSKNSRLRNYAILSSDHPAGLDVVMVVYHLLYDLLVFASVWVGGLGSWAGGNQVIGVFIV
jgi:hypothetical protein